MEYKYVPDKICPRQIIIEMEDDVLKKVEFVGGCNGNLKGLSTLVEGMTFEQIKAKLSGIQCGFKDTSCPDQLVKAMERALAQKK